MFNKFNVGNMKRLYLLFCLPLLLPACTGGRVSNYAEKVFTVDLQKKYPVKEIVLQEVAEVEYIPLETNDSLRVIGGPYYIDDRYIIIANYSGDILFFNRDGTFSHSFNKTGNGGQEYGDFPYRICPDFEREEIYMYDYWWDAKQSRIQVYGFDGTYRRTFLLKGDKIFGYLVNYDSNTLFVRNNYGMSIFDSIPYSKTPFYMISKQDGKVDSLPIRVEKRMSPTIPVTIRISETETTTILMSFPFVTFSKMGGRIVLSEFAQDTVYTYESGRLSPFLVKRNRMKGKNTMMLNMDFISGRYVLMSVQERTVDNSNYFGVPDLITLWYDRKDNSLSQVRLMNADGVSHEASEELLIEYSLTASRGLLPDKCALQVYLARDLLEWNEEGKLKGRLKEIASSLKEEDNPVLMLVKFKE